MKKKAILALSLAAMALSASAQDNCNLNFDKYPRVGRIEVEIQAVGAATTYSDGNNFGYDGGVQVRENIQGTPWSYGVYAGLYFPGRTYTTSFDYVDNDGITHTSTDQYTEYNGGLLTGIVGEYDLRRGSSFNPYASLTGGFLWGGTPNLRPFVRPTIGIEVFQNIRMGVSTTLTTGHSSGYSFFISAVIGGRKQ